MKDIYKPITKKEAERLMRELVDVEDDGIKRPKSYWKRHEAIMEYFQLRIDGQI